jgi:hypothetical protein
MENTHKGFELGNKRSLMLSSDPHKANSTLDKTIEVHYDAQVNNYTLLAKAIGVSQE